ncbi:hypothetical protein CEXT_477751 [Caerostris extrusa]|uniref:Uncharacterized protein n=1 Tax=Caerostris extrusa TaxID=172846 RepID=A0AAV4WVS5_CAEEX|nr:hypothetical protein CEXT_477751 [Caerostris extrusa]
MWQPFPKPDSSPSWMQVTMATDRRCALLTRCAPHNSRPADGESEILLPYYSQFPLLPGENWKTGERSRLPLSFSLSLPGIKGNLFQLNGCCHPQKQTRIGGAVAIKRFN